MCQKDLSKLRVPCVKRQAIKPKGVDELGGGVLFANLKVLTQKCAERKVIL